MELKPEVLAGLRQLFCDGTTTAGLLRYLGQQHDERLDRTTIHRYLMEAFAISFFDPVRRDTANPANEPYYATLSWSLIPEIATAANDWLAAGETPWWAEVLNGSGVANDLKPEWLSAATWAAMTPSEQEKLRAVANSNTTLEAWSRFFARLAERLQRRLAEAEERVGQVAVAPI